jgi:pyruvate dehydrogenase (quinone)
VANPKGAEILIDTLRDWGVNTIFGLPGDGINGIMEALRVRQNEIRFIQVRHEESAAFMASGYAKFTGKLGVCLATSGPGGLHLTNGLYDAKLDQQPVVAITGHHYHDLIDTFAQQDVDLCRTFQDLTVYNTRVMGAGHVAEVTNLACRSALVRRGVAHINFPVDLQDEELKQDPKSKRNIRGHSTASYGVNRSVPAPEDLKRAADVLNAGEKTVILAGQGALGAGHELEAIAERLAAPIAKALLGKAAVPDDSPYTTGPIGLLGTSASAEAMTDADTILIVGSSFPYIEHYPKPGQAKGVQIDSDAVRIGLRYPVEVGLVGDSRSVLSALLPLLRPRDNRKFLEKIQKTMSEWREVLEERSSDDSMPMKPQVVARAVGRHLKPDAIVATDSGTITTWAAREIPVQWGSMFTCSGNLASMASGLPYAIAAQVAHPNRQVIAFVGDGGISMLIAELATAVKYQLPIKIVVIKNNTLGQIKWEQMVFLGNPEFGVDLQPVDFVQVAKGFGVDAYRVERPQECDQIVGRALSSPGPALIEAVVDPLEPPLPGHTTVDQVRKMTKALIRGEPDRASIAKHIMADKVRELV